MSTLRETLGGYFASLELNNCTQHNITQFAPQTQAGNRQTGIQAHWHTQQQESTLAPGRTCQSSSYWGPNGTNTSRVSIPVPPVVSVAATAAPASATAPPTGASGPACSPTTTCPGPSVSLPQRRTSAAACCKHFCFRACLRLAISRTSHSSCIGILLSFLPPPPLIAGAPLPSLKYRIGLNEAVVSAYGRGGWYKEACEGCRKMRNLEMHKFSVGKQIANREE